MKLLPKGSGRSFKTATKTLQQLFNISVVTPTAKSELYGNSIQLKTGGHKKTANLSGAGSALCNELLKTLPKG
jgi:hypothetical protein